MIVLIRDALTCPPSMLMSFRELTSDLVSYGYVILLESDSPDIYYRWIKPIGGMDFVEDIVRPGEEKGIRIDVEHRFRGTIVTDRIVPENVLDLEDKVISGLLLG